MKETEPAMIDMDLSKPNQDTTTEQLQVPIKQYKGHTLLRYTAAMST